MTHRVKVISRHWATALLVLLAACGASVALGSAQTPAAQHVAVAADADGPPPLIPAAVFARSAEYLDPDLSPLGAQIVARTTIDGRERIVIHSLVTGRAQLIPLPADAQVDWFEWAGENRVLVGLGWSELFEGEETYVTRLLVFDIAAGLAQVLGDQFGGPAGDNVLYVDPAGQWLLLSMQETWDEYPAVFRYELSTGEYTETVKPKANVWEWYADTDGIVRAGIGYLKRSWFMLYRSGADQPFRKLGNWSYTDEAAGFDLLGIASGTDQGYLLADGRTGRYALYRYNFATQKLGDLVYENPTNDIEDYTLSRDGRRVMAVAFTDDRERVLWLDPAMRAHQQQLEARFPGMTVLFESQDARRERFIVWVGGANDPGSYYFYVPSANLLQRIAQINAQIDPRQLADTGYTRYRARDGLEIPAYLTLPKGREPRGLPLIVLPHGGPYYVRDLLGYDPEVQFLANRGYAVLQPNFRGSSGYGTQFAAQGEGQWGRAMQDDLDDGVDWLAQRGVIDPRRVCVVGSSYGGYAALWAVTRNPERYRCAASFAGVTDVAQQLRYQSHELGGAERSEWQATVRGRRGFDLDSISPLKQAGRLTRPVLLAHGDADKTVLYRQSTSYRDALQKAGKSYEFIAYPGEEHGFEDPDNMADWLTRLETFLARHNPAQ